MSGPEHSTEKDAGACVNEWAHGNPFRYCACGWIEPEPVKAEGDQSVFIGSVALLDALYETYREHIGITEPEGPDGPYIWCGCGWRSDTMWGPNDSPGQSYALHLTNAQHAAAVKALQPIVRRVTSPAKTEAAS